MASLPQTYFLGCGNLSKFMIHELSRTAVKRNTDPSIVLLLGSSKLLRQFLENESKITIKDYTRSTVANESSSAVMSASEAPRLKNGDHAEIKNLVVSDNFGRLEEQLVNYKKCLTPESNLLILKDDRSVLNEIYHQIWENPEERPNIYQAFSSIKLTGTSTFEANYIHEGRLSIAKIPNDLTNIEEYTQADTDTMHKPLFELISHAQNLNATFHNYKDFSLLQYERLVIRACIGPLTHLFDCYEGELLHLEHISDICKRIIRESVYIISKADPLLASDPISKVALDPSRLLEVVLNIMKTDRMDRTRLRRNLSVLNAKELFTTNGYLAHLGAKNGIRAHTNHFMRDLIKAQVSLQKYRLENSLK